MPGAHVIIKENGTEETRRCRASTPENCPFYKNGAAHGATKEEAWQAHEEQLTKKAGGAFGKLSKRKKEEASEEVEEDADNNGGFDVFASLARLQSEKAEDESHETSIDSSVKAAPTRSSVFGDAEYRGYTGKELFHETNQRVREDKDVGVYATRNEGLLTTNGAFNDSTVHGLIDYRRLESGDDSRVFGFTEIEPYEPYMLREFNNEDEYSYSDMTDVEYAQLDTNEKHTMNAFTGNDFMWVNNIMYGKEKVAPDDDDDDDDTGERSSSESGRTASVFSRVASTMDSAINKGPKKQRFLYRAIKGDDQLFGDFENGESMTANDWLSAADSRLGTEVSFAGYQSTSDKTDGVKKFSRDNGVIMEILTPEGVSVATNSEHQDEYEVVLPRNQRYMVVGTYKHVDIDFPQTHHTAYRDSADNMTVIRLVAINSDGEVLDGTNSDEISPWTPEDH